MAKQVVNIGALANDGTGDQLRTSFTKVNANFTETYNDIATLAGGNLAAKADLTYVQSINSNLTNLVEIVGGMSSFSGDYNDLINTPIIPSTTSQLLNNSGFITTANIPQDLSDLTDNTNLLGSPFDQSLNTSDSVTFATLNLSSYIRTRPLVDLSLRARGETQDYIMTLSATDGSLTFPDGTVQTTAYTGAGASFDQNLNTTDSPQFARVIVGPGGFDIDPVIEASVSEINGTAIDVVIRAGKLGDIDGNVILSAGTRNLIFTEQGWLHIPSTIVPQDNLFGLALYGEGAGDPNAYIQLPSNSRTEQGDPVLIGNYNAPVRISSYNGNTQIGHNWDFNPDGSLTLPGDGVKLSAGGMVSNGDFVITLPGSNSLSEQVFRFTDMGGTGQLQFPDGTLQTTAFAFRDVPNTSAGSTDDKQGNIAANSEYFYYCVADNTTPTPITIPWTNVSNFSGSPEGDYIQANITDVARLGESLRVTNVSVNGVQQEYVKVTAVSTTDEVTFKIFLDAPNGTWYSYQNSTLESIGPHIWKRVAWSGDTW